MKTLRGYIAQSPPLEWSQLFKEVANVAYMIKYMFRESLQMAKDEFEGYIKDKSNFEDVPHAKTQLEVLDQLIQTTFETYGKEGIFDPQNLATIDFLNQPELLVNLVESNNADLNADMIKMKEVTSKWMQYMISRNFPPLTPHHTQAFTVLMMAGFQKAYLSDEAHKQRGAKAGGGIFGGVFERSKLELRSFIAQMATGEGKSIVIAMLAIFMVQVHGMKVHILENNEGLLERDFDTNRPFFEAFGIRCGVDLLDGEADVVYCLKSGINQLFLRKMLEGKLVEALGDTVVIVDEVDDLVVNEDPNSFYVKEDVEKTPDLQKCFQALLDSRPVQNGEHGTPRLRRRQRRQRMAEKKVEGKTIELSSKKARRWPSF